MITQVRPLTSPMMFITSATLARGRRLSMIASSESRRFAIARARTTPPTSGRDDEQVVVVLLPQVAEQDRRRVDVVDRDVEEALDLVGVQVHHHHAIDAHGRQHVGDDLGGDRHARRARAPVLPRVAEVRDRGGDAAGRRALQRIDHHQDFHQVVVGRRAGRLQHEDVAAAHVLQQLDHHLAVGEATDDRSGPRLMLRCRQTASASFGFALPVKILIRSKAMTSREVNVQPAAPRGSGRQEKWLGR